MPRSPRHALSAPAPFQDIAADQLDRVSGGAGMGDIFGSLLNNAGPILQGITGLIGMFKGGGQQQAAAAPAGPDPAAAAATQAPDASAQPAMGSGGANPLVSVSVSMNGQQIAGT